MSCIPCWPSTGFQGPPIAKCAHGYIMQYHGESRWIVKMSFIDSVRNPNNRRDNPYQEASIMKALPPHPHVLSLLGEMEVGGWHCLVFERCRGDLFDILASSFELLLATVSIRRIFHQLVGGIQHIHQAGFVHLDISLENLLLDEAGNIKITDFGLALPVAGIGSTVKMIGKLPYIAPELVSPDLQRGGYDIRAADVYSAGVCLFFLTFGHPPYQNPGDRAFELLMKSGVRALCREYGGASEQIASANPDIVLLLEDLLVVPSLRISVDNILQTVAKWSDEDD